MQSEIKNFTDEILIKSLAGNSYFSEYIDSTSVEVQDCESIIYISSANSITNENISFSNCSCSTGSNVLINDATSVTFSRFNFEKISDNSSFKLISMNTIGSVNLTSMNLYDIVKDMSIIQLVDAEEVYINSFTGKELFSNFLSVLRIESSSSIYIYNLSCESCATARGNGAVLNLFASSSDSTIYIKDFKVTDCKANDGFAAGIYIDSYTTNSKHLFTISDFYMSKSTASDGTAITISFGISFHDSSKFDNFIIERSNSSSGGIITDGHQKGYIEMSNFKLSNTSGLNSFLKCLYTASSLSLKLTNITVQDSYSEYSALYFSSISPLCEVIISNLSIISNNKTSSDAKAISLSSTKLTITSLYIDSSYGIDANKDSTLIISILLHLYCLHFLI